MLEVLSRKHKLIFKKCNEFSSSISKNIFKNNINAKVSSIILFIDNIGKDTKLLIDIIMKCVGSFICEYVLSGHDVNFCYLTIAILSRLYSLYCSRLSQMAQTRKILFIFYKNINANNYQTIYWNDFNLFIWPNKVMNCNIINSININRINKMTWNQFDDNTLKSINVKEMDMIIKQIFSNNYETQRIKDFVNHDSDIAMELDMKCEKIMVTKLIDSNNSNKHNYIVGQKRKLNDNKTFPIKKKPKILNSTFELIELNKTHKKIKMENQEIIGEKRISK